MKNIAKLILLSVAGLGLMAGSSYGDTFDFSYTYVGSYFSGQPLTVTGSLQGVPLGNFVEQASDISLFFNGVPITGTVYAAVYDGGNYVNGTPVISFDATQNNFLFANSDYANGDQSGNSAFLIVPPPNSFGVTVTQGEDLLLGPSIVDADVPIVPGNWSLTDVSLPDSGSTVSLLGIAAAGLALVRRNRKSL